MNESLETGPDRTIRTAGRETLELLVIRDEMLDSRSYAIALQTVDVVCSNFAIQQRIFGERLEASATEG